MVFDCRVVRNSLKEVKIGRFFGRNSGTGRFLAAIDILAVKKFLGRKTVIIN